MNFKKNTNNIKMIKVILFNLQRLYLYQGVRDGGGSFGVFEEVKNFNGRL